MESPKLHRFNFRDYYRMEAVGILAPDARVELLDGQIHDMSPIGPLHGGLVNRLIRFFSSHAKGRWLVSVQNPVRLNDYSEPQPDLMLLRPAPDDYTIDHPGPDDVLLLIEVSDSSLKFDQRRKIPAYGSCGVSEVWIVNLDELILEAYTEPLVEGYRSKRIFKPGDRICPQNHPDVVLGISDLFGRPGTH